MRITLLTLFPEIFSGVLTVGMVGRAQQRGVARIRPLSIREFGLGRHRVVDDASFGGGPGMVLRPDVLDDALHAALAGTEEGGVTDFAPSAAGSRRVIYLSPQGKPFTQADAQRLAQLDHLILLCGRYEGVDERFCRLRVDEEISLGDFVLTGGEIPAMAVLDAVVRLLPGVLGDAESASADSFSEGLLDHPHYTRPARWTPQGGEGDGGAATVGESVPPLVLLSGDHGAAAAWRRRQALLRTLIRRPDLLAGARLDKAERRLLEALRRDLEEAGDEPL
ncbi:MAG: tRNA (guanosine(37)-N1)-methyltransferase TrmD [Magnetococcales bacterium]|nr:tRNA (guanosine(37)-N1)-methyltransferase TrmD [Magnetococcales bacterium]